jgi:hypothetical protein
VDSVPAIVAPRRFPPPLPLLSPSLLLRPLCLMLQQAGVQVQLVPVVADFPPLPSPAWVALVLPDGLSPFFSHT